MIQIEGRVSLGSCGVAAVADQADAWRERGATHVSVSTMSAGLGPVRGHLDALAEIADALHVAS